MKKFSALAGLFIFMLSIHFIIPQAVEAKVVKGIVLDKISNKPVPDAAVMLVWDSKMISGVITDTTGVFSFDNISLSKVKLRVNRVGYYGIVAGPFVIPSNDTLSIIVQMESGAVQLDEIVVHAIKTRKWLEKSGYYFRKEQGLGRFVDFEQMDLRSFAYATNALRLIPGLMISSRAWLPMEERYGLQLSSSRALGGGFQIYLDGIPLRDHGWLDVINANELAAVEFYPRAAFAPMEFRNGIFQSGVLVIWTKQ